MTLDQLGTLLIFGALLVAFFRSVRDRRNQIAWPIVFIFCFTSCLYQSWPVSRTPRKESLTELMSSPLVRELALLKHNRELTNADTR